jgi:hypothetical protein
MQVKRVEDNPLFTLIRVMPWPDIPWTQDVTVTQMKMARDTHEPVNDVTVRFGQEPASIATAREFAQAILRACDIAEQLEKEGAIALEGE